MKLSKKKCTILFVGILGVSLLSAWSRHRFAKRFAYVEPGADEFRVVTWNVGYFAPVADKNLKDVDVPAVASLISGLAADVVVLQELGRVEQADQLADLLGETWQVHAGKTGHGNQVMAVFSPLEIQSVEVFECGGRATLGVSLRSRNATPIFVLGVHAPHPARGTEENVENIRCALAHVSGREEAVRIVTGDLNYNFDPGSDGAFYSEIMQSFGDGSFDLGETYYARTRIDHVFHLPKDLPVLPEASGMVDLPIRFAKVPGFRDHRPVVVSYDLSEGALR
ncbi:endonuclease/exonuclease/phosphatase family protein [Kiritimatiellaeota bacterium B1221]|nr:endonuclease/exonuclease/phosphatase family protein [Kiritimatiellaeota bacterium B1221]